MTAVPRLCECDVEKCRVLRREASHGRVSIENGRQTREVYTEGALEGPISDPRRPHKIRYSSDEWTMIVEQARSCGRPPARYVRETSLGSAPKARRSRENDGLIHELGRIGTSLTRLVAEAGESPAVSHQETIEAVLADLVAAVRRLSN